MIFYGTEEDALSLLSRKVAADSEPALSPEDLNDVLSQAKRADVYGRPPTDENWSPSWEIDWAAAEGWEMKAALAASKNQTITDGRGTASSYLYLNCVRMAEKFRERILSSAPITKRGQPYSNLLV